MFNKKCEHQWNLITKTYAPPSAVPPNVTDSKVMEKVIFGVSSYMWECSVCGDTKTQEMLGTDENQLETIIENVEREGMQYIKHNGQVYAIAKWVPSTPIDKIPLK